MRLYAFLTLAVIAIQTQAASIPAKSPVVIAEPDVKHVKQQIKLIPDQKKEQKPENNASEEELIQPVNTVQDVGNELRTQKIESVVENVVPETNTVIKLDTENEIKDEKIEKPQQQPEIVKPINNIQKPEVQNVQKPEHDKKEDCKPSKPSSSGWDDFEEEEVVEPGTPAEEPTFALDFITDALNNAHKSVQLTVDSFAQAFNAWLREQGAALPSEVQIKSIIEVNIRKINLTLQGYFSPDQAAKLVEDPKDPATQIEGVETDLKNLEKDFENDVRSVLSSERAENGTNSSSNSTFGGPPIFQNIQQVIQQGFNNISSSFTSLFNQNSGQNSTNNLFVMFGQNIGNFFNPSTEPGTQSDEGATSRPNIFQSIQNIFRPPQFPGSQPNQQADQPQPNRPIINAIQTNPIVQSISGVFNRQPNKPAEVTSQPEIAKPVVEGSNVVPEPSADPEEAPKPEEEAQRPVTIAPGGPIQQAIQKNPIVKGITEAVHKIQDSIGNPEKPRKIGLIHHLHHGIHHHGGWNDNNNNNNKFIIELDNVASAGAAGSLGPAGSAGPLGTAKPADEPAKPADEPTRTAAQPASPDQSQPDQKPHDCQKKEEEASKTVEQTEVTQVVSEKTE